MILIVIAPTETLATLEHACAIAKCLERSERAPEESSQLDLDCDRTHRNTFSRPLLKTEVVWAFGLGNYRRFGAKGAEANSSANQIACLSSFDALARFA